MASSVTLSIAATFLVIIAYMVYLKFFKKVVVVEKQPEGNEKCAGIDGTIFDSACGFCRAECPSGLEYNCDKKICSCPAGSVNMPDKTCCKQADYSVDDDGVETCCSAESRCKVGDGKEVCCPGGSVCDVKGKVCRVPCGPSVPENTLVCKQSDKCIILRNLEKSQLDEIRKNANKNEFFIDDSGTAYLCQDPTEAKCKWSQYTSVPSAVNNNVYPCYKITKRDAEQGVGFCTSKNDDRTSIEDCNNKYTNRTQCVTNSKCQWTDLYESAASDDPQLSKTIGSISKTYPSQQYGLYCDPEQTENPSSLYVRLSKNTDISTNGKCSWKDCLISSSHPDLLNTYWDGKNCIAIQKCKKAVKVTTNDNADSGIPDDQYTQDSFKKCSELGGRCPVDRRGGLDCNPSSGVISINETTKYVLDAEDTSEKRQNLNCRPVPNTANVGSLTVYNSYSDCVDNEIVSKNLRPCAKGYSFKKIPGIKDGFGCFIDRPKYDYKTDGSYVDFDSGQSSSFNISRNDGATFRHAYLCAGRKAVAAGKKPKGGDGHIPSKDVTSWKHYVCRSKLQDKAWIDYEKVKYDEKDKENTCAVLRRGMIVQKDGSGKSFNDLWDSNCYVSSGNIA